MPGKNKQPNSKGLPLTSEITSNTDLANANGEKLKGMEISSEHLDESAGDYSSAARKLKEKAKADAEAWSWSGIKTTVKGWFSSKKKEEKAEKEEKANLIKPNAGPVNQNPAPESKLKNHKDVLKLSSTTIDLDAKITVWSWSRLSFKNSIFNPRMKLSMREYISDLLFSADKDKDRQKIEKGNNLTSAFMLPDNERTLSKRKPEGGYSMISKTDRIKEELNVHRHGNRFTHFFQPVGMTIFEGAAKVFHVNSKRM